MKKSSIWLENINYKPNDPLSKDIEVDVLIIGGGITGLSTAYHLINSGLKVCLVEKNIIAHGVTSKTTGKLTYLQELVYSDMKKIYNIEKSKLYLESQQEAIKIVKNIINENKIECDYNEVESYVFSCDKNKVEKIKEEKKLLESFKIPVKESKKLPDNKKVEYAISVEHTGVFHPLKYLIKMKEICEKNGISIYENTKIINIYKDNLYICKAENNIVKAKKIVIAMHYPYFLLPFFMPTKTHLEKSYIMAIKTDKNLYFSAIAPKQPTLSIRYLETSDKIYKILLKDSHNLAFSNNEIEHFSHLIKNLKQTPDFIWSNKDIITSDKLPYIGRLKDDLFIGTGYNTWGMTNGSLAGKIISDLILNKNNRYTELFDPKRGLNIGKILNFPINLISNVKSFTASKINKNKSWYSSKIIFEKINGKKVGIYIDENNKKHIVLNKCPHLKCGLIFNEEEKTWDCPCHGSRFDIDGKCIEGPSNYDITYHENN